MLQVILFIDIFLIFYSLEADSLYRAQLERYAASLAAASGNPSLGLGAVAALSPYSMLASGYSTSALGLVPTPSPISSPLPEGLSHLPTSSLGLQSMASKNVNSYQYPSLSQNSATKAAPQSISKRPESLENNSTTLMTDSPVLQQRLTSIPTEEGNKNDVSKIDGIINDSKPSLPFKSSKDNTNGGKEKLDSKRTKKKVKSGNSQKRKSAGK